MERVIHGPRACAGLLLAGLATAGCGGGTTELAWTEERPRRVVVDLDRVEWPVGSFPVVVPLDRAPGNPASLRVSEIDAFGDVRDAAAPFQYDADDGGGELTLLVEGDDEGVETRRFAVYYDDGGTYDPAPVGARVVATGGVLHEGQESVRVETGAGTWYYHLSGAGFASFEDGTGLDWLGYRPGGGPAGEYRGIPNLVYPEGYFHPGGTACTTRVVATGPLRVVLDSECGDGTWAVRWEIFRSYARLTVLRVAHPYWFLYEGTPGGAFDERRDFYVLSDGSRFAAAEPRDGDLPEPEWLYFGDEALGQVLWLAHDIDDDHPDAYYPMEGQMTVFGFGRQHTRPFLTRVPARFLVGKAPTTDHARVAGVVETALARPRVRVGGVEARP